MHDLPPESMDEEPLLPYIEEAELEEAFIDEMGFEELPSSLFPLEKEKASRLDLFQLAHSLRKEFPYGLTWKDYAQMIAFSIDYLDPCTAMSLLEKREAIITTLNYVIAQTEKPFLPMGTYDPLFNSLLKPFIDLALEAHTGQISLGVERPKPIVPFRNEKPTKERLEEFTKGISRLWQSGYQWHDFAQAAKLAILFLMTFEDISQVEIREGMIDVLHLLIETSRPQQLPEDFNEEIFCSFIDAFAQALIPLQKKHSCL